jgi:hypothetical protein
MLAAALFGLLLTAPACAHVGGVLTGRPDDLYGEVRSLDTRRGYLQIREDYGRDFTVRYDGRTRVVYGSRSYPVSSLHRGDLVRVRVAYDRYRQPWAERIEVRRDVRDGGSWRDGGAAARVARLDGIVRQVDYRRGWFVVERGRYDAVRVLVGRYARSEDVRRFERLRRGQRVRVEVRTSFMGEAELIRFR